MARLQGLAVDISIDTYQYASVYTTWRTVYTTLGLYIQVRRRAVGWRGAAGTLGWREEEAGGEAACYRPRGADSGKNLLERCGTIDESP